MKKAGGYVIMILGLIVLILSPAMSSWIGISKIFFYIIGFAIMFFGLYITMNKKERKELEEQLEELPIYEGKKVIGYRRKK